MISSNDTKKYAFLGARIVPDEVPGQGPLMGIVSALKQARNNTAFVIASDIPVVNMVCLKRLLRKAALYDCAVLRTQGGYREPLYGVYKKNVIPVIWKLLHRGERSVQSLFSEVKAGYLEIGKAGWYRNLNTPTDYYAYTGKNDQ